MCIASFIGDDYTKKNHFKWPDDYSARPIPVDDPVVHPGWPYEGTKIFQPASKEEVAKLKKELEDLKILLEKANEYDKANNEPHCESEEKISTLKNHGEALGVDIMEAFDDNRSEVSKQEIYKVVSPSGELAAKFDNKELADKFCLYIREYTGQTDFFVYEVFPTDLNSLNFGVYFSGKLIAAFTSNSNANDFAIELNKRMGESQTEISVKVL